METGLIYTVGVFSKDKSQTVLFILMWYHRDTSAVSNSSAKHAVKDFRGTRVTGAK